MQRQTLKIGLAGLGAVGLGVARRLETGIPGLGLAAISVRDKDKARRNLPDAGSRIPIMPAEALAQSCDIVIECLPPDMFRQVATSVIDAGRIFMPLSVGQLLENWDFVTRAKETGARILVPTGALIGLDAVRAAAEGTIRSVRMITRKPPNGLQGAPYLREHNISLADLKAPLKDLRRHGARGARGFPAKRQRSRRAESCRHRPRPDAARNLGPCGAGSQHPPHRGGCRHRALFHVDRERSLGGKSAHRPHRRAEHRRGAARACGGAESRDVNGYEFDPAGAGTNPCDAVHAIAQARGLRPVGEDVAEMATAAVAGDRRAGHAEGMVVRLVDGIGKRRPEARPAGAAVEFGLRGEQRQVAAGAGEGAGTMFVRAAGSSTAVRCRPGAAHHIARA